MGDVSSALLDRHLFSISDAAEILQVPVSTLKYWVQGIQRGEKIYLPALRETLNQDGYLTWGEFVEANLLKQLRDAGTELDQIRTFSRAARIGLGWEYPLARHSVWSGSRRDLIYQAQLISGIDGDSALLVAGDEYGSGQQVLELGRPVSEYLEAIRFDGEIPVAVTPDRDLREVTVEAQRRFGAPQVSGVPTEALWTLWDAGESVAGIAQSFELTEDQVQAAIEYENRHRDGVAVAA